MKQGKKNKIIFDIKPVFVSKKVREIINKKKEKERKILPSIIQKKKNSKKIIFRKIINLKTDEKKEKISVLKPLTKISGEVKKEGYKSFDVKVVNNSFGIKFKDRLSVYPKNIFQGEEKVKAKFLSKNHYLRHIISDVASVVPKIKKEKMITQEDSIVTVGMKFKPDIPLLKILSILKQSFFHFLNLFLNFYLVLKQKLLFRLPLLKRSFRLFILISFFLTFTVQGLAFSNKDLISTRGKILDESTVAYQYLLSGGNSFLEKDFDLASYKFNVAAERFASAQQELNRIGNTITYLLKIIPGGSVVSSGKNLLEAGANIAFASKCLAEAFKPFSQTEDIFAELKNRKEKENFNKISFTFALAEAFENLERAQKNLRAAKENLERVNPDDFPEEIRPEVLKIKIILPVLISGFDLFTSHIDVLLEILGHNKPKKYLLLFENDRELRASGGFIGTYGLFDMKEGKIENLKVEGPYAIDGQLKEKYIAPEPLRLIQPRFFMHDANWFLDFPTSAKKIILLHEKAGGPTVDGIIVFTASVFQELLKITGPIEMPEYGTTVTADNFYDETQREVELEYDRTLNEPKKFIADLLPRFFEKLASQDKAKWIDVINIFSKKLAEKHILIYFADERLENLIQEAGFAGEVKATSRDYLAVVASNIGGGKTDHIIEQQIFHFSEIQPDGSIIDTVKIKRKHNGDRNNYWTSIKNMCFLRIYVPQGSKLIEASGFDSQFYDVLIPPIEGSMPDPLVGQIEKSGYIHEPSKVRITQEGDKTVFGNFVGVEVGQEKEVILKYQLPFKILLANDAIENYSLFIQKQPGTSAFKFSSELFYPQNFDPFWQYPSKLSLKNGIIKYETTLETDKLYAVVFKDRFSK